MQYPVLKPCTRDRLDQFSFLLLIWASFHWIGLPASNLLDPTGSERSRPDRESLRTDSNAAGTTYGKALLSGRHLLLSRNYSLRMEGEKNEDASSFLPQPDRINISSMKTSTEIISSSFIHCVLQWKVDLCAFCGGFAVTLSVNYKPLASATQNSVLTVQHLNAMFCCFQTKWLKWIISSSGHIGPNIRHKYLCWP